jgi:FG-GAP-like repeat
VHAGEWSPAFALPAANLRFSGRDAGTPSGWTDGLQVIDLDADGRADLAFAYDSGSTWQSAAWLSNGQGWTASAGYAPPLTFAGWASQDPSKRTNDTGARWMDLNGDGKPDLVQGFYDPAYSWRELIDSVPPRWITNTEPAYSRRAAWINMGSGWIASSAYAPPTDFVNVTGGPDSEYGVRTVDLNGDGKADLVQGNGATRAAWVNTGSGWLWNGGYTPPASFAGSDVNSGGLQVADIDGDGLPDYLQGVYVNGTDTRAAWLRSGPAPDLLSTVSNGIGGTIGVGYRAAPQIAGAIDPASTAPGVPNTAPQQLMTQVTTSDGRLGSYATAYGYHDARIQPGRVRDQRNLGFGWISTPDASPTEASGSAAVPSPSATSSGGSGSGEPAGSGGLAGSGEPAGSGGLAGIVAKSIKHAKDFYSQIDKPTRMVIAGSLCVVGWHVVHASLHILGVAGLTPVGAVAGVGVMIFGLSLMAVGATLGTATVNDALRDRPRRRKRKRGSTDRSRHAPSMAGALA